MTPRRRLEARIPVALKAQLTALARTQQVALTDLVEAALRALLTTEPTPPPVTAQLARVLREMRELQRGLEVLEETLGLFINVYLSTTPEVPPEQEDAARRLGGRRYTRFLKVLEGKLARAKGGAHDPAGTADGPGPRA
ncbi:MAG: hypothetical protein AB7N91_14465 [Candidatus Tectimicrobiota bacterium]